MFSAFQTDDSGMEGDDEKNGSSSSTFESPDSIASPAAHMQELNILLKLVRLATPGQEVKFVRFYKRAQNSSSNTLFGDKVWKVEFSGNRRQRGKVESNILLLYSAIIC